MAKQIQRINWSNPVNRNHPLNRGLLGWWLVTPYAMGGLTLRDLAGKNDGTLTSMDPATDWVAPGRRGAFGALIFDGTNDYILVNGIGSKIATNHTISMWIKKDGSDVSKIPFSVWSWTGTDHEDLFFWYEDSSNFHYTPSGSGTAGTAGASLGTLPLNVWTHVVGTYDGSTTRIYKNGVLQDTGSVSVTSSNSEPLLIGADADQSGAGLLGNWWDGSIDDVRIVNRTYNAAEVWQLYLLSSTGYGDLLNRQKQTFFLPAPPETITGSIRRRNINWSNPVNRNHPLNQGLAGWWLNTPNVRGGLTFRDLAGGHHGTLFAMDPATDWVPPGRPGAFGALDIIKGGALQRVNLDSLPTDIIETSNATISAWFRPTASPSGSEWIVSIGTTGNAAIITLELRSSGAVTGRIEGSTSNQVDLGTGGAPWSLNEWQFGTVVYNRTTDLASRYMNGRLLGTDNISIITGTLNTGGNAFIGHLSNFDGSQGFNGQLDDVRLYNRALNAAEVSQLYDLSSTGYGDLLNRQKQTFFLPAPPETKVITGGIRRRNTTIIWSNPVNRNHPLNRGLVAWWLNTPNVRGGLTFRDLMGRHHGTLTSMDPAGAWAAASPRTGFGSLEYDGTYEYVTHNVAWPKQRGTIICQVRSTDLTHNNIFAYESDGTGNSTYNGFTDGNDILECHMAMSVTPDFRATYQDGTGGSGSASISVGVPVVNTWYTIAVTWNRSGNLSLYVDGAVVGTADLSGLTLTSKTPTFISTATPGYSGAGRNLEGNISSQAMFDREFSAAEIRQHYNLSSTGYGGLLNRQDVKFRSIVPIKRSVSSGGIFSKSRKVVTGG